VKSKHWENNLPIPCIPIGMFFKVTLQYSNWISMIKLQEFQMNITWCSLLINQVHKIMMSCGILNSLLRQYENNRKYLSFFMWIYYQVVKEHIIKHCFSVLEIQIIFPVYIQAFPGPHLIMYKAPVDIVKLCTGYIAHWGL
jgi:hypothetical protein